MLKLNIHWESQRTKKRWKYLEQVSSDERKTKKNKLKKESQAFGRRKIYSVSTVNSLLADKTLNGVCAYLVDAIAIPLNVYVFIVLIASVRGHTAQCTLHPVHWLISTLSANPIDSIAQELPYENSNKLNCKRKKNHRTIFAFDKEYHLKNTTEIK